MSGNLYLPITSIGRKPRGANRVWYKPNHRSFGAFMKSDQMRDVTSEAAHDIARQAKNYTPSSKGGANSEGMHTRVRNGYLVNRAAGFLKVGGNLRVKVEVINTEAESPIVEFGGRGQARIRALGRAGADFGDFHPEGGPK